MMAKTASMNIVTFFLFFNTPLTASVNMLIFSCQGTCISSALKKLNTVKPSIMYRKYIYRSKTVKTGSGLVLTRESIQNSHAESGKSNLSLIQLKINELVLKVSVPLTELFLWNFDTSV